MKFERPSRIQASTLPMILTPPFKDLIAQVGGRAHARCACPHCPPCMVGVRGAR